MMDLNALRLRNTLTEKKNAFDPTILHLRDEYREDSFDLQATLSPDEYYTLMSFITAAGNLYLEYTAYNEVKSQFPVTVSQFPKCQDDLHEYPESVTRLLIYGCY